MYIHVTFTKYARFISRQQKQRVKFLNNLSIKDIKKCKETEKYFFYKS